MSSFTMSHVDLRPVIYAREAQLCVKLYILITHISVLFILEK